MNPLMKNIIVLTAMISMIIPLMIYAQPFLTNLIRDTSTPTFYIYTGIKADNLFNIVIRVEGVAKEDVLYIYQIYINGKPLQQYDANALINEHNPSEVLPIKITTDGRNLITISLSRVEAGQLIEIAVETSIGRIFRIIQI